MFCGRGEGKVADVVIDGSTGKHQNVTPATSGTAELLMTLQGGRRKTGSQNKIAKEGK